MLDTFGHGCRIISTRATRAHNSREKHYQLRFTCVHKHKGYISTYTRIGSNRGNPQSTIMQSTQSIHTHSKERAAGALRLPLPRQPPHRCGLCRAQCPHEWQRPLPWASSAYRRCRCYGRYVERLFGCLLRLCMLWFTAVLLYSGVLRVVGGRALCLFLVLCRASHGGAQPSCCLLYTSPSPRD